MTDLDVDPSQGGSVPAPVSPAHPDRPQGLVVAAVIAVAVALGAATVAAIRITSVSDPVSTAPQAAITQPPPAPASTTAQAAEAEMPPDPESALQALGTSFSSRYITRISEDECGAKYAMLEAAGKPHLYRWTGSEWQNETSMLDVEAETRQSVVDEIRALDVTMDGTNEFLVRFTATDSAMFSFGGVFGPMGCDWRWIPIVDWDDPYRFIDSIAVDEYGALVAVGFAGSAGRKSVYLDYSSALDAFSTYEADSEQYAPSPPPPNPAPKPYVVSTYCVVKALLNSDMQGTLWSVTIYNQWSDGGRTVASTTSRWSWSQPYC